MPLPPSSSKQKRRSLASGFPSLKQLTSRTRSRDDSDDHYQQQQQRGSASGGTSNIPRRASPPPPPPPPLPSAAQQQRQQQTRSGSAKYRQHNNSNSDQQHPISKANQKANANNNNNSVDNEDSIFSVPNDEMTGNPSNNSNNGRLGATDPMSNSGANNSNNNDEKLASIYKVYGPHANIYTDVLKVSSTATPSEIREAFFCLRYDIYQKLDNNNSSSGGGGGSNNTSDKLTSDERKEVEERMDAITGAFHILSDGGRRRAYDASLLVNVSGESMVDDMGFPIETNKGSNSGGAVVDSSNKKTSPPRLTPSKADSSPTNSSSSNDNNNASSRTDRWQQRRNVFRRRANARNNNSSGAANGMNEGRKVQAKEVAGGLNTRPKAQASESSDSIFSKPSRDANATDKNQAKVEERNQKSTPLLPQEGNENDWHRADNTANIDGGMQEGEMEEPALPVGVDKMNAREQMLYKNQMYLLRQQKQKMNQGSSPGGDGQKIGGAGGGGRVGSRYGDRHERNDKYNSGPEGLASPTGVEDFHRGTRGGYNDHHGSAADEASIEQTLDDDDDGTYGDETLTYGDDDGTYGDETLTYGDDETTTLGDTIDDTTIGESTYTSGNGSYYDDESYATNEKPGGGRFSPGHKKGKVPQPILKSGNGKGKGKGGGVKRPESDNAAKRVTIHSHRGRGEENDDLSLLFENATCPVPSLASIQEEVTGTYKDFTQALHQVSNAFVISPDDIDRMADKIRDAKIELGENYAQQVKERSMGRKQVQDGQCGSGRESPRQGTGSGRKHVAM